MAFLHTHVYFHLCYFHTISFGFFSIYLYSKSTRNDKLSGEWNMEHRHKMCLLHFSTLFRSMLSAGHHKEFFTSESLHRWTPFKNTGERNVNRISVFYGDLIQSHQALKMQMENTTTVKFQGRLHSTDGGIFLVYFALDWALVTTAASRRSCTVPVSRSEFVTLM